MFRLPFLFIITGIVSFIVFQVLTLFDLASWMGDYPRNPTGWFHVHLLVLGWGTMIAMGAVYQLINVVLQSKIYSQKLGFAHYGFFAVGTTGLLIGFHNMNVQWIAGFATIAFIGIILFAWNMGATLIRAKQWNAVTVSTACSVLYLTLTGLTGMAMGLNFHFNQWGSFHEQLFGAHIWFGTLGWFGFMITGISYKMLPMFYLSHGYPTYLQKIIIILWNAGVIVGATSFLLDWPMIMKWFGLLFIVLAFIVYNIHISLIYKFRHKPNPGNGIVWSIRSARSLAIVGIITLILFLIFPEYMYQSHMIVILGWIYLWGWVAITILSYLSKIVPFLWWTHKYGPLVGKQKIPTMADLINDRYVQYGLCVITFSLLVLLCGLGWNLPDLITIGGSFLAVGSFMYIGLVARVFTR
ncbi:MAG: hypothetical protein WDZ91_10175 [Paenibacillaceae bacterium]